MTQPQMPQPNRLSDAERPTADELTALYREGSTLEPGPLLDQRILAAAKTELANDQRRQRVARPWWKVLLVPVTTVAVGVLGISLAWRVADQQERDVRATMNAAETSAQPPAAPVAKAPAPSALDPETEAVRQGVRKEAKSDRAIAAPSPRALPEPKPEARVERRSEAKSEAKSAVNTEAAADESSLRAAPAPAPAQVGDLAVRKKAVEAAPLPAEAGAPATLIGQANSAPAAVATPAAPAAPAPMPAARDYRADRAAEKTSGATMEAATAPDDAATPEDWIKHIGELRAAGREAEAARSLARFRLRYPDHAVPRDLGP